MLLPGIYILSTLFLFVKIWSFPVAGIFLSVCYLPGLCFITLFKRDEIEYEDLILAFPYSIGISSIFILCSLFLGISVEHAALLLHGIIGMAVLLAVYMRKDRPARTAAHLNRQEVLFCLFALFLVLLESIPFLFGPNRIAISAHGFHHSVLVTQIIHGIFPPENPGLGGTIIGYYWGFHALIAALTVKAGIQQIEIIFLLNILSLYFIFCISYGIAKGFNLSEGYRYMVPLAIMGLMRADAGLLFLAKLISGNVSSLSALTSSPVEPYEILDNWIRGLSWVDSRLFFLHKLYNVSGMMLALCLCYAYLLILLKRGFHIGKTDMTGIALVISACFFNYPPLAVFLLFHAPLWCCYVLFAYKGGLKEKIRHAGRIAVPYVFAGLIVSPYMLYIIASRDVSSGSQGGLFSFAFYDQSMKNMVVFMVPFPIILYGAWVSVRKLSLSKEFFFLFVATVLCLVLTVLTRWPFNNSYKFDYILALFLSLFFLFGLERISAFIPWKSLKRLFIIVILLLLLSTPLTVESSHIISSFSTDRIFLFSGGHIVFAREKERNGAYKWLRENTPYNSLLMLTYTETNWPCCGLQSNYQPAALSERTLYVIRDKDYTVSNPEYERRIVFREKLFNAPDDQEVIDYFQNIKRPIYFLDEDNLDLSRFHVENRFKPYPSDPGKKFKLVYKNDFQRVYLLLIGR